MVGHCYLFSFFSFSPFNSHSSAFAYFILWNYFLKKSSDQENVRRKKKSLIFMIGRKLLLLTAYSLLGLGILFILLHHFVCRCRKLLDMKCSSLAAF